MADNSFFEKLSRWLGGLLLLYVAVLAVQSVGSLVVTMVLNGAGDADLSSDQLQAVTLGLLTMGYSAYAQVAAYIATAVLFLRLLYKAVQQAKGFSTPFTYVSPGWAVGYWFIPIVGLYKPYRIMDAWFKACAKESGEAKPAAGEQLLSAWWALFILGILAGRMVASSSNELNDRAHVLNFAEYTVATNVLMLAASLFFWLVIKRMVQATGRAAAAKTFPGGPMPTKPQPT